MGGIRIVAGTGQGATAVSAYDAALAGRGLGDATLLPVRASLPPGIEIARVDRVGLAGGMEDAPLQVVISEGRSSEAGRAIVAGLGWLTWPAEHMRRGLIAGHAAEAGSLVEAESATLDEIYAALRDLCRVRDAPFDPFAVETLLAGTVVERGAAAAVVAAIVNGAAASGVRREDEE